MASLLTKLQYMVYGVDDNEKMSVGLNEDKSRFVIQYPLTEKLGYIEFELDSSKCVQYITDEESLSPFDSLVGGPQIEFIEMGTGASVSKCINCGSINKALSIGGKYVTEFSERRIEIDLCSDCKDEIETEIVAVIVDEYSEEVVSSSV